MSDITNVYFLHIKGEQYHFFLVPESKVKQQLPEIAKSVEEQETGFVSLTNAFKIQVTHVAPFVEDNARWLFWGSTKMLKLLNLFPLQEDMPHLDDNKIMYFVQFHGHSNYMYIFTHENLYNEIQKALIEMQLNEQHKHIKRPRISIDHDTSIKVKYKDFDILTKEESKELFGNYFTKLRLIYDVNTNKER